MFQREKQKQEEMYQQQQKSIDSSYRYERTARE